MTFDINEARAIIEAAKQRGMIKDQNSEPVASPVKGPKPLDKPAGNSILPDWLQEGIRQGPLVRSDEDSSRR